MDGNFILITVLVATMLGMAIIAFAGPSPEKARKRRVATIRGRHGESAEALLEARMRKAISNRPTGTEAKMLVSLIPNPDNLAKRIKMTGKKWTLSQYMTACAVIFLVVTALLMLRGFPFFFAVLVGLAAASGTTESDAAVNAEFRNGKPASSVRPKTLTTHLQFDKSRARVTVNN